MELLGAALGMGAGILLDPVFLLAWVLAGMFSGTLKRVLQLSSGASVALRIIYFAIFSSHDAALLDPLYLVVLSIITILVGLVVSILVHLLKLSFWKSD